jgi:hypothetical protein
MSVNHTIDLSSSSDRADLASALLAQFSDRPTCGYRIMRTNAPKHASPCHACHMPGRQGVNHIHSRALPGLPPGRPSPQAAAS